MKIQEKAAGARTARHKGRRGQVLLVSRAMDCLGRGLMDALDEAGLEADQVDCGSWAVARVVQGAVDLVLLDLNLPELGALELILCIRRFWPELPIVALAGAEPGLRVGGAAARCARDAAAAGRVWGAD